MTHKMIVPAALVVGALLAAPAHAAPIRECGDPDRRGGARNLTTRVWTCEQGRDMVRAWKRGYKGRGVKWTEKVRVHGRRTVTDVRATMRGGYVTRFQFYGVAYGG